MNFVTPFPFSHDVVPLIYSIKGCLNNTVRGSWVRYLGPKTKVGIYWYPEYPLIMASMATCLHSKVVTLYLLVIVGRCRGDYFQRPLVSKCHQSLTSGELLSRCWFSPLTCGRTRQILR